jgi:hypothetical protein
VELAVDRPQSLEDLVAEGWEGAVGFDQVAVSALGYWDLEQWD